MLNRLSRIAYHGRWYVLASALAFAAVAAFFGAGISHHLGPAGFGDPATDSSRADKILASNAGRDTGLIVLVRGEGQTPTDRETAVRAVETELRGDELVTDVTRLAFPGATSKTNTYLSVYFQDVSSERRERAADRIHDQLADRSDVAIGGPMSINRQLSDTVESDVQRAELIGLPLLFLLSLLVFRGLVAAALPPLIGGLTIVGTFLALRLIASSVDVSVLALNLVTAVGLGLAVDYSLFMVSRYREEIAQRGAGLEALRATMLTAGRTVLYSAFTIAIVMASLMIFPQSFLFSMGLGGCIVALLSVVASIVVLPAILALLGNRVNALAPARLRRSAERESQVGRDGAWFRLSKFVMGRAGLISAITGLVLVTMALPLVGVRFVPVDASVLPHETGARQVDDALRMDGMIHYVSPIALVVPNAAPGAAEQLRGQVSVMPGIAAVGGIQELGNDRLVLAVMTNDPYSDAGQQLVRDTRALSGDVLVTGPTAQFVDLKSSLARHLPLLIALVGTATILALFLMTGSVVLGIKTLVMNLLTFAAVAGLLVCVFQYRWAQGLLGFTSQGALEVTAPILLFAASFALSTDYGVFLLARVKEARDAGAGDSDAVSFGQERTGRQITAAAALFCVAVGSFATSSIVGVKETTLGIAFAVIIDATLIRMLLMPALMHLLGSWNWWSPRPVTRVHTWIVKHEGGGIDEPAVPAESQSQRT